MRVAIGKVSGRGGRWWLREVVVATAVIELTVTLMNLLSLTFNFLDNQD